jgi:beta-N-acetylhexosaminidase
MFLGLTSVLVNLFFSRRFSASRIFTFFSLTFLLFLARGGLVLDFYILPLLTLFAIDLALAAKALIAQWPQLIGLFPPRFWVYSLCLLPILLISQHLEVFTTQATASQLAAVSFIKQTLPQDAVIALDDFALIDFKLGGKDGSRFANADWFSKLENDPEIRDNQLGNQWERLDYLLLSHEFLRNLGEGNLPFLAQAYNHSFLVKDFPPSLATERNLESFYSTGGDWATLLGVAPFREEKVLARALFGDLLAPDGFLAKSEEKVLIGVSQPEIDSSGSAELVVAESDLEAILARMTLEEKIGQLFLVGFDGRELIPETKAFLSDHFLGGVLLLAKNVASQEQLIDLTRALGEVGRNFPLLIALDEEGGRVSRVDLLGIDEVAQGEIKSAEQAYLLAQKRGQALAQLGIGVNLAPVLDVVRNNYSFINADRRSFGNSEEWVSRLGLAMIKGYQEAGVLTVPKHFPGGLGRTLVDPHQQLPVVDISKGELEKDLWSFREAIKAGVPAIMVSHLLYPQIDNTFPASLSPKFITSILRENLGFEGLVIIDDLKMNALEEWYTLEEAVKYSFQAGADMFIISGYQEDQVRARNALLTAVQSGEITEERLNQSVVRILKFKNVSVTD